MKDYAINRREFLKDLGMLGGGAMLMTSPWLNVFADSKYTKKEKAKVAVIGLGSRGTFLLNFLLKNPRVEVTYLCDMYPPHLERAYQMVPTAKTHTSYQDMIADPRFDAVIIAVPLIHHYPVVMQAFAAGKHVFCEKTLGFDMKETYEMYQAHLRSGKIFFAGQQRLFDPRYIRAMEMIHAGTFGDIQAIRTFWYRNNDWRRPVPEDRKESEVNWRLYKGFSRGLMSELACHQLQIGTWAMRQIPNQVFGHGAITHWNMDERTVYDNVHCMYTFDNGVKMTFDSVISNKFYGLEEQIMGHLGTVEPEKGKYYFENPSPAPAFLQLLNDWENKLFDTLPFAGTSWAPETANVNHGEFITGDRPKHDGTSLLLDAFAEAVITGKQPANIAEEGYYASQLCLLGHEAMRKERIMTFPDEYKIDYLNHKAINKNKEEQAL